MIKDLSFDISNPKFTMQVTANYEGATFHCVIFDSNGDHHDTQGLDRFADLYKLILTTENDLS